MSMSLNDILLKMIRRIDLFETVPDNELIELAQNFNLKFYQAWTPIIKEGTLAWKIYVLHSWLLEARKSGKVLGEINPGEIFWEMSFLKWTNAFASVIASQDCDVWEILNDDFNSFLKSYPEVMDKVYEKMREREYKNENNNMHLKTVYTDHENDDDLKDFKLNI